MTKAQAIKYSLISILSILLGVFIVFKVWWTHDAARFLGLIGFVLVGFGSLLMSVSLTRIIIPTETVFGFSTITDPERYQMLKQRIGAVKAKTISAISSTLFIVLFGGTAYGLVTRIYKYEKDQLSTFGQTQEVVINDIGYKGKGTSYAFFDFYFNGKTYSNNLDPKDYEVGDSATIIFSTNDPDIVKWADDFDANGE
jgi:hypothetical protein